MPRIGVFSNLKVSKLMAKYGPKTLNISMGGGNIPKAMSKECLIGTQHSRVDD
jgi:hypothetical protein